MVNTIRPTSGHWRTGYYWLVEAQPKSGPVPRLLLGPLRYSIYMSHSPREHGAIEYRKLGQTDGGVGRSLRNAERARRGLSGLGLNE